MSISARILKVEVIDRGKGGIEDEGDVKARFGGKG
jgi:hypothetical protein